MRLAMGSQSRRFQKHFRGGLARLPSWAPCVDVGRGSSHHSHRPVLAELRVSCLLQRLGLKGPSCSERQRPDMVTSLDQAEGRRGAALGDPSRVWGQGQPAGRACGPKGQNQTGSCRWGL